MRAGKERLAQDKQEAHTAFRLCNIAADDRVAKGQPRWFAESWQTVMSEVLRRMAHTTEWEKTMKQTIGLVLLMLVLVGSALAQVDAATVERAANAVPTLHSMMKDPDSFVLERVLVAEPNKKHPEKPRDLCFFFRAHNSMGGYGDTGRAWMNSKGKLSVFDPSGGEQLAAGIICNPKHQTDITADVKTALAPPAPPARPEESAEDKAKHAQQYADCLKVAVSNPSIVCKQ
jgi:hypothetical protein